MASFGISAFYQPFLQILFYLSDLSIHLPDVFLVSSTARLSLGLCGKLLISTAYDLMVIWCLEMFPTKLRWSTHHYFFLVLGCETIEIVYFFLTFQILFISPAAGLNIYHWISKKDQKLRLKKNINLLRVSRQNILRSVCR